MRRSAVVAVAAVPVTVAVTIGGCAAIGGLDDYRAVDCVVCGDGGVPERAADAEEAKDAQPTEVAPREPLAFATIGGTLEGLLGKGLILRDNGADDLQLGRDGPFAFPAKVRNGDPYAVTIGSQPNDPTQTCSVANGSGVVNGSNVEDVRVTCATSAFSIGGNVVGLSGTGLVLTNVGEDLPIAQNGPFTFSKKVASGASFDVTVKSQPASGGPCVVSGGKGSVGVSDVSSVVVNCAPGTYTVGGTVSGLTGTAVLQLNGGDDLTLTSNGSFAFTQTLTPQTTYSVTVLTQPSYPPRSQTCTVASGSGTIGGANVTTVSVTCTTKTFSIGGTITGLTGTVVLENNNTDDLSRSSDGTFTFATPIQSGDAYSVTVATPPTGQTCVVSAGAGTVTTGPVTNVAVACSGSTSTTQNPGIKCGSTYCSFGSKCCDTNGFPACTSSCTGPGTTTWGCDSAQDCAAMGQPTQVCCGTSLSGIFCSKLDLCTSPKHYYCDPTASNPCPNGGTCTAADSPAGYYQCY